MTGAVEEGWKSLEAAALAECGELQRAEMRKAFYAGAQWLLNEISQKLDPGDEATEADLARLQAIDDELREFGNQLEMDALFDGLAPQ